MQGYVFKVSPRDTLRFLYLLEDKERALAVCNRLMIHTSVMHCMLVICNA